MWKMRLAHTKLVLQTKYQMVYGWIELKLFTFYESKTGDTLGIE